MYRQGDVLIVPIETPNNLTKQKQEEKDNGRVVLEYGEVTGHAHAIAKAQAKFAAIYLMANAVRVLHIVKEAVDLRHEEHGTINLKPGSYQVVRQQEYTEYGMRNVLD